MIPEYSYIGCAIRDGKSRSEVLDVIFDLVDEWCMHR